MMPETERPITKEISETALLSVSTRGKIEPTMRDLFKTKPVSIVHVANHQLYFCLRSLPKGSDAFSAQHQSEPQPNGGKVRALAISRGLVVAPADALTIECSP